MRVAVPFFLSLLAALAGCQGPRGGLTATPQRPTLSSSTATTAVGSLEVEAGGVLQDGGDASVPSSLKYGPAETTEIFASLTPFIEVDDSGGIGDLSLGARHRFADEQDGKPAFALQSSVKIPTASEDRGLGSGEVDVLVAGIVDKSIGDWSLTGFGEADFLGDPDGGTLFGQSVAVAAGTGLSDSFGAFGELAGVFVPEDNSEQVFTTVGVTYSTVPSRVFDIAVNVGLSDDAEDFAVLFGFTQNLGRVHGHAPAP